MRSIRSVSILFVLASTASCAPVRSVVGRVFPDRAERWARQITIHRDGWGVPHIYGPTDASVVFGLAYAQAEDNFWQVEDDVVRSIGRAAELYGEGALADDLVRAALDVERLSRAEYEAEPPERRALWEAWAAGLNYWMRTHPLEPPRLLRRFEPWHAFARFRSGDADTRIDGVRLGDVLVQEIAGAAASGTEASTALALAPRPGRPGRAGGELEGSNAWAVAPTRTANGHAMIFQNPHVSFFGTGQRYEAHLDSEEGYHVSGFAILGTPLIRTGHNERLAWMHTNTAADVADAWVVDFPDAVNPLAYRYADSTRTAIEWEHVLRVRVDSGLVERRFRFRRTHQGPVVRLEDGRYAAIRMAKFEEGGSLQEWYAMGRAQDLDAFRAALSQAAFPISNTMYADVDGNIMFVQGNAVPKRDPALDPSQLLDGADPSAEWQGYHSLDELPQLVNPASGWIQNTNATPFLATADGSNLDAAAYPSYMAPEPDNARARSSRAILAANDRWTFDAWANAAFDTHMVESDDAVPAMIDEWERLGANEPDRAVTLDVAIEAFRSWDGRSTIDSPATTLFVYWLERFREQQADTSGYPHLVALEHALDDLRADWDTVLVPWGEVNRLQRIHSSGEGGFDPAAPSLSTAGAPGWTGIIFNVTGRPGPEGKRRFGVFGDTWVGVVDLSPEPVARSIVTFGQSAHPDSPHWFDQAPLYAAGRFKEAWFRRDDVLREAERSYRPGHEDER